MLKNISKLAWIFMVLALSACGGGGSTVQGQGNTLLSFTNTSGADISRAVVTSITSKQVTSDQSVFCATNADCSFLADASDPVQVVLYNGDDDPVAAYYNYAAIAGAIQITTDTTMLGIYLFRQIDNQMPNETFEVGDMLGNYFSLNPSPDNTSDVYEELGQYYKTQLALGQSHTSDFYSKLISDLNASVILPVNTITYASNLQLMKTFLAFVNRYFAIRNAQAGDSACPLMANMWGGAGGITAAVSGWKDKLMTPKILAPLFGSIGSIWGSTCDSNSQIVSQLNEITNKLNLMQAQLDSIQGQLSAVFAYIAQYNANNTEAQINSFAATIASASSSYSSLMQNGTYTSLRDYIDKHGGLQTAVEGGLFVSGNGYLKNLLCRDGATCLAAQLDVVAALSQLPLLQNLQSSLAAACNASSNKDDRDFLAVRTGCNIQILRVSTKFAAALQQAKVLLNEEYTTLQYYANNGSASDKSYLAKSGFRKSDAVTNAWSDTTATVNANISNAMSNLPTIKVGETDGLFDPILELRQDRPTLVANIAKVCPVSGTTSPNIISLFPHHADRYLTVGGCIVTRNLESRYYYMKDSEDVAVALGVLVPKNMLPSSASQTATNRAPFGEGDGNITGVSFNASLYNGTNNTFYLGIESTPTIIPGQTVVLGNSGSNASYIKEGLPAADFNTWRYYVADSAPLTMSWIAYSSTESSSLSARKSKTITRVFKLELDNFSGPRYKPSKKFYCVSGDCSPAYGTYAYQDGLQFLDGPTFRLDQSTYEYVQAEGRYYYKVKAQ
jgi:hypothetical protein